MSSQGKVLLITIAGLIESLVLGIFDNHHRIMETLESVIGVHCNLIVGSEL